jgi:outer membrane protein insertion porin family
MEGALMRIGVACTLILLLVFPAFAQDTPQVSGEWYRGKPISDIIFEGLHNVSASELDGVVEPFIGQVFSDETFWEIHGRLYALEYFESITPSAIPADASGSAVIIRFRVVERPTVSRITFTGNNSIRRGELLDVVSLKINDVANQAKLRMDETAVVTRYQEKGFPDVRVSSEISPAKGGTVQITFFINEGEKLTIDEILFEGNSLFSNRTLRGQLSLKVRGRIGIINDGAFQEAKLTADIAAITQYYRDRGYIDAEVIDVIREKKQDEKGNNTLTITFRIYEGKIYTFGGITFEGNQIFSGEQLSELVYSKIGESVNARRVEADLQRIMGLYTENGYIFNSIIPNENRDRVTGVLSFKITIVERGRAHIENIIVRGNEKTKDHVLLREIPLEPGDVFSRTKLMDGQRNLMNLQYFSSVIPDMVPGSSESLMDLIFTVEEQPTTDVQLGLTFSGSSDAFPISGLVKWNDRNFLGYGDMLGAEVNASPDTQSGSLQYTKRWIFGLPLSGGFDFTVSRTVRHAAMDNMAPFFNGDELQSYPDGFDSYEEYVGESKYPPSTYLMEYRQWGLSLGFSTGYRFATAAGNLSLGGGLRTGAVLNKYDTDIFRPFDPVLRDKNNEWINANSIWTSLSLDQRDVYYDPSKGYYGFQRFGYYGVFPFEREHYIRSETKAEYFHTLFNLPITDNYSFKAVFGIHTGVSFILRQPGYFNHELPLIENANKLLIDGMFVGRGWTGERFNRGLALWENWAEIRMPVVPGILALDWFFDAAAVKPTVDSFFNDFRMEDMRFSLGGGIRFAIPQFPFRFIFAKRFLVKDGVVEWQKGNMGNAGLDFIISFALSTY